MKIKFQLIFLVYLFQQILLCTNKLGIQERDCVTKIELSDQRFCLSSRNSLLFAIAITRLNID